MKDNDSDNDQGFVPTKVEIKADHKLKNVPKVEYLSDRPLDFQGRYIFGEGLLRKQPVQVYARFSQYLPQYSSSSSKPVQTQFKQEQQSDLTKTININKSQIKGKLLSDSKNPSQKYSKFIADSIQQPTTEYKTMQPSLPKDNSVRDMAGHPYEKFIQNPNYTLVYSRYKDRIQTITAQSDDFSENQINLTKVLTKYDPDHYSVLKAFQFIPIGKLKDKIYKQEKIIYHVNHPSQSKTRNHQIHDINETYTNRENSNHPPFQVHLQPNHSHSHIIPSSQNILHVNNSSSSHNSHMSHQNSQLQHQVEDLQFDSKFQCGNLLYAFKTKSEPNHYILFLQNDTNSYGYNQWFYFSLRNMKSRVPYKFTIVNLRKRHSLFKQGMKISVFSLIDAQNNSEKGDGCGWRKTGNNIKYERSVIKKYTDKKYKFYSLSFDLEFPHDGDQVKVSMNIPYSYSRLIHHLKICNQIVRKSNESQQTIQKQKYKKTPRKMSNKFKSLHSKQFLDNGSRVKQIKQKGLQWEMVPVGYSISNNAVPYITISSNKKQIKTQNNITQNPNSFLQQQKNAKTKKAIVFLARQHPGQTWSSFMMQQILYAFAQCKSQSIKWLLQNYTIKIFPMVNVDGVIYGNFRCDLAGFDLNRNWRNPDKNLHPQIYAIKAQMQKINSQYKIQCVLDLHGHSKQYNTFSYACKNDTLTSRVLSLIISQINPIFHFPYCTFGLSRYKQTTARAYLYRLTGSQNILTIQNSFYGAKVGSKLIVYDPEILRQLSNSILQGLHEYLSASSRRNDCQIKVEKNIQQYLQYERKAETPTLVDSGSESQPYADQISIKQKIKKILPKSFKSIESQLEQQEKIIKKKHTIKKKDEKKQIKIVKQYKTVNPSSLRKTRQGKQTQTEQVDQTYIQRNSLTYYKKNSKQIPKKQTPSHPANSQQTTRFARLSIQEDKTVVKSDFAGKVGDVGLPFYIRQKSTLVPIKLKNDSLEIFKDAYNATSKNIEPENIMNVTMMRPSHKKVKIINSIHNEATQQFPILCVLSEQKKKQSQLQKTHAMLNQRREKGTTSLPPKVRTFVQNQKLQSLKRHNKQKNANYIHSINHNHNQAQAATSDLKQVREFKSKTKEANLISKIWRQNFARYGKDLNVFFGGIKG